MASGINRQAAEQNIRRNQIERDLEKTGRDIRRLIEAIKWGVPGAAVKDEMTTLEARRIDLLSHLKEALPPMSHLHANIAEVYRQKVDNLAEALNEERTCAESAECIRELIEEIRPVPDNGTLRIELYGQLAALINLTNEHPRSRGASNAGVAGARNQRCLHLDYAAL
jgi:site-specific DNA recombinase